MLKLSKFLYVLEIDGFKMFDAGNNPIIEFLRNRRSVVAANLAEPGPSEEELSTIIEIGLRVPDHSRCGPWRIQIIRKEGQAKLGSLYADLFSTEDKTPTPEKIEYWRERPQSAPIARSEFASTSHVEVPGVVPDATKCSIPFTYSVRVLAAPPGYIPTI